MATNTPSCGFARVQLGWLGVLTWIGACSRSSTPVAGGDPERGKAQIVLLGCGSCHVIPGIGQASGMVGPPLTHFAGRSYIAGEAPNTEPYLIQWIMSPQSIEPGTAMPNLGVTQQQARDIAAYLYTIR
jgi:cytochrome c1